MSAIVCGKRSFFEDNQTPSPTSATPPVAKKLRCSSATSPLRFSPSPPPVAEPFPGLIDQLRAAFPDMADQLLEKVLEDCGYDLESAIKMLDQLRLGYTDGNLGSAVESYANEKTGAISTHKGETVPTEASSIQSNLPVDGAEWVELFVREMVSATSVDDARTRATKVLESLEKSISARASAEAAQSFHKENMVLKEQIEVLLRENSALKRLVAKQHERQKDYDERNQEVQQLRQLVAQYQEQLTNLELNNYTLAMHLQQAQQGTSIPGRFHPDVF